jgi:hypothetical protein
MKIRPASWVLSLVWRWASWWRARRHGAPDPQAERRLDFDAQTRRMGIGMTELLRERARRRWLRIHRSD